MDNISIVIPAYEEEATVELVVREVSSISQTCFHNYEIILVNDGSKDHTGEISRRLVEEIPCLRVVEHYPNRGYGGALKAGFNAATKDLIAFIPADGQYDFSEIRNLLDNIDHADIVCGYRYNRQDNNIRKINAWGWNRLVQLMFGYLCRDVDCGFKLFRRELLEYMTISSNGALIDTEFLAKARLYQLRIVEVPVTHFNRKAGRATGANLKVIFKAFKDLVGFRFKLIAEERVVRTR